MFSFQLSETFNCLPVGAAARFQAGYLILRCGLLLHYRRRLYERGFVCAGEISSDGKICGEFGCSRVCTGISPFDMLHDRPRFGDELCTFEIKQVLNFEYIYCYLYCHVVYASESNKNIYFKIFAQSISDYFNCCHNNAI